MLSLEYFCEVFQGFLSDLATRNIDNPLQTHRIIRIEDETHIGEDILDFLSLIELHSPIDTIGDILADKRLFDQPRLSIRPVEDSEIGVISLQGSVIRSVLFRNSDTMRFRSDY